jgi:hypothetical protein
MTTLVVAKFWGKCGHFQVGIGVVLVGVLSWVGQRYLAGTNFVRLKLTAGDQTS